MRGVHHLALERERVDAGLAGHRCTRVRVTDLDIAELELVDDLVAQKLTLPLLVTRVVANRMRTMLNEGLILNVMTAPTPMPTEFRSGRTNSGRWPSFLITLKR